MQRFVVMLKSFAMLFYTRCFLLTCMAICCYVLTVGAQAQPPHNFFAHDPQTDNQRVFYGGFTAGGNFSQVDGDGFTGYHKAGLNFGPIVYASFNGHFGASMELLYSQKGSRERNYTEDAAGVGYVNDYDLKMNYVEVPLMLRYYADNRLHFGAGVSYSQLINYKETAITYAPVNLDTSAYSFHRNDLCLAADVNYEFYKGWFLNFRFNYSIRSIRDADHIPENYGRVRFSGQYNNYFTLRLIYLIH